MALDDETKLWRDWEALLVATDVAANTAPMRPRATTKAVAASHARWRLTPARAPRRQATLAGLSSFAVMTVSKLRAFTGYGAAGPGKG